MYCLYSSLPHEIKHRGYWKRHEGSGWHCGRLGIYGFDGKPSLWQICCWDDSRFTGLGFIFYVIVLFTNFLLTQFSSIKHTFSQNLATAVSISGSRDLFRIHKDYYLLPVSCAPYPVSPPSAAISHCVINILGVTSTGKPSNNRSK